MALSLKSTSSRILFPLIGYTLICSSLANSNFGCRDENNKVVDWIIAYKFPNEFSYGLVTPDKTNWFSNNDDLRYDGFLKYTFDQVFNDTGTDFAFGMYNDEVPQHLSKGDVWYGHMKGLFAFPENNRGFWLIHSVPKLSMKPNIYVYPNTSKEYAQHFFCVTLNYSTDHLAISRPLIESFRLPKSIEKSIPKLKDIFSHKARKNASLFLSSDLNATRDDIFLRIISKSRKFYQDLYSDLVAPDLKVPLLVETWRHSTSNLPSNCTTKYWVQNIEKLEWPKSMNVKFKSTQDHSKWTTSTNEEGDKWTCFGDINRSGSQFARGGGTLCIKDPRIWKLFRNLVVKVEDCPITIPWSKLYPSLPLN
ncbi:unnamed protein product [Rodentolepis nana]|uniref:Plancitoxin-1 n=1 Tax=Rodentolepis nana TaxID=102285 RepID=A0A0R3T8B4_RODNA|nr:unnamed protein product [Rodentolepis nana]